MSEAKNIRDVIPPLGESQGEKSERRPLRKLGDVVIPGRDYEAKVKIVEVLDHEVVLTGFDHVVIMKEVELPDGTKTEIVDADYYNVKVEDGEVLKTFSTGAQPIAKVLDALNKKDLPLLCEFHKAGKTYVIE